MNFIGLIERLRIQSALPTLPKSNLKFLIEGQWKAVGADGKARNANHSLWLHDRSYRLTEHADFDSFSLRRPMAT
jgi:hypothetical protein